MSIFPSSLYILSIYPLCPIDATHDGWKELLDKSLSILQRSQSILIVAGAGMGVDSGLPDYRSEKGMWRDYPPLAKLGLSLAEMSHPDW